MKNSSSENSEAIAKRDERAKKLYRYISDVARRIDEATAASQCIADLFTTNLEVQRQKLRDNCEKLVFLDPVNYGKKSIELLWRKVYYDTVSAAKKHRETESDYDNFLFTHIVCGIGHFHHFITRIQSEMNVQYKELDYTPLHHDENSEKILEVEDNNDLQMFGRSILHSCLIYLGDLSRYQAETFHAFDSSIAARYYLQAAHIDLSSGMPYNQLGNLYQDKNHNLDSVCYYIQCLSCTVPFEGAAGNLTKLFEKNLQYHDSLNNSEALTQAEHIQLTISQFLSLIEVWYFGKEDPDVPQKCSMIAHQIKTCLDLSPSPAPDIEKNFNEFVQHNEEENLNPSYLNGNIIHKIVLVCLFTIAKVSETDEKKAFSCKAFTLALLSQLLQKLSHRLKFLGFKNPADKFRKHSMSAKNAEPEKVTVENNAAIEPLVAEIPDTFEKDKVVSNELVSPSQSDIESKQLPNGESKNSCKKSLAKRRRRRRVMSSESSDISDSDTGNSEAESIESCSNDDEDDMSDSSCDSEDDNDDEESIDDSYVPVHKQNGTTKSKKETSANENFEKHETLVNGNNDKNELDAKEIQNFLRGENFLPSIKLLQDWVLNEKDLITSCGESGEALFQCVVDLLNIFTLYFKPNFSHRIDSNSCKILDYARSVAKKLELEYKTIPLPEDVSLRGTNICKFDKDAAEWQLLNRYQPSIYEENVIRILNFIDFGNQIASILPRIRFNRSMQILYLKKSPTPKQSTKINHKKSREWHNSKKPHSESVPGGGGLLRRLGRLWLTARVRELERSRAAAPTLLAVDAAALARHLRRVKQLLRSKLFILLVPTVVVQELDELKREESSARDAIRWLEVQLQGGSRFVRAQRPAQTRPLPLLKYPRKAPPHIHNYIQILEFCHHFVADDNPGGNGDSDHHKSAPLLVFLTGNEPGTFEEYKDFSVTGAAQTAGVTVEFIGHFYSKWRQTVHKKR